MVLILYTSGIWSDNDTQIKNDDLNINAVFMNSIEIREKLLKLLLTILIPFDLEQKCWLWLNW